MCGGREGERGRGEEKERERERGGEREREREREGEREREREKRGGGGRERDQRSNIKYTYKKKHFKKEKEHHYIKLLATDSSPFNSHTVNNHHLKTIKKYYLQVLQVHVHTAMNNIDKYMMYITV